jgi:hypothetical protein
MAEVELPNPHELEERANTAFGRRVALTTAVFAVVLAIASLGGNNAMKEMLLAQQLSSDQWAYYQAKVIREHVYRSQRMILEASGGDSKGSERLAALAQKFGEEEKRYNAEKKDVEKEARKLERDRDINRDRDPYFDYAEVLLQIAIVCSSISILSSSRPMFWFSLGLAILGSLSTINGFTLLARLPFLHGH